MTRWSTIRPGPAVPERGSAGGDQASPRTIATSCQYRAADAATVGRRGHIVPAEVTVYEDRSFSFRTKTPLTASLLREAAGLAKGAERPNGAPIGWISRAQLGQVAEVKMPDLNAIDLEGAERIVAGTARSMGIGVRD